MARAERPAPIAEAPPTGAAAATTPAVEVPKTVAGLCDVLERIAPLKLAQAGDNVGLIAGDLEASVSRVLLCIDLTAEVVEEAIRERVDFVVAYHPPIYRPVASLRTPSAGTDAVVFRCIRSGIAIYSPHTALDAAQGGTNDVMAGLCGMERTEPLEAPAESATHRVKVVVFVPATHLDDVAEAMFAAGAGRIGDYARCSYRLRGQGTFLGGASTHPAVGERGRLEYVEEVRLEVVAPSASLSRVVRALRQAHPYEEPAFDLYPLQGEPTPGIGRVGILPPRTTLGQLARRLKKVTAARCVQVVGPMDRAVTRGVVVVGAAGSLPHRAALSPGDVVVTGEIRHHDALSLIRSGATAVALGHWASERPALAPLASRLSDALTGVPVSVSSADADPMQPV
ncbi:MAG: Nif3-like dinuclear metal center hexameric protein [Planctomycetes bacterium]|nr:Nif3-like dinuclear metal center hexameric protein [Planctomycetota bacterium]